MGTGQKRIPGVQQAVGDGRLVTQMLGSLDSSSEAKFTMVVRSELDAVIAKRWGRFSSPRVAAGWAVAGITLVALILRLLFLNKSFWFDEAWSVKIATAPDFLHVLWNRELYMTAYYALLRGWVHLGSSEFIVRLLSVIPGVATIPVVYALGTRLLSRRAAIFAAVLLATNATHVAYSQEAKSYSLVVFFVSVSTLFFLCGVGYSTEQSSERQGSLLDRTLYALSSVTAVYSHFFAVLVIAAQWLALGLFPRHKLPWRRLLGSAAMIIAAIGPVFWWVLTNNQGQLGWIPPLKIGTPLKVLAVQCGNPVALVVCLGLWAVALRGVAEDRHINPKIFFAYGLILSWLFLPLVISVLASLKQNITHPRYLLVSMPAAVLLAAGGLDRIRKRQMLAVVVTVLVSVGGIVWHYSRPKDDWRGATPYVLARAQSGDAALFIPEEGRMAFDYYQQRFPSVPYIEHVSAASAPNYRRVWLMVNHPAKLSAKGASELGEFKANVSSHYHVVSFRQFWKIDVSLYERD